jgi:hypothetical protein
MRDPRKWAIATSQFYALRAHIPNYVSVARVAEYHAILDTLEFASGEDFSPFRIPESEIRPIVTSISRGTSRSPGQKYYSKEPYADRGVFTRQIEAVWHFLETLARTPPSQRAVGDPVNYWELSDEELELLAIKHKIGGYGDSTGHIDRQIIIDALLKRDVALRPTTPLPISHSITVGNMSDSVIQQGIEDSIAPVKTTTPLEPRRITVRGIVEGVIASLVAAGLLYLLGRFLVHYFHK